MERKSSKNNEHAPSQRFDGATHACERHPDHNDDRSFVTSNYAGVFDGVGGKEGSERAAVFVSEFCYAAFEQLPYELSCADAELALRVMLEKASVGLQNTCPDIDISTTAAIALQHRDPETGKTYLQIAHAGDSRVYVIRNGQIYFVTLDHALSTAHLPIDEQRAVQTEIADARYTYEVDPFYLYHLYERNIIGSALGSKQKHELRLSFDSVELQPGDIALVTSDGIHDNLTDTEIANCAQKSDIVQALVQQALTRSNEPREVTIKFKYDDEVHVAKNFRSKYDDMTAVVIHVTLGDLL